MATAVLIVLLAITALLTPGWATQQPATFFVTSPNVFRVGVPEKVLVTLIRIRANIPNVPVRLSVRQPDSRPFFETSRSIRPGLPELFDVTIEAEHLARNEGTHQHMVLKAESLNSAYPFEDETEVLVTLQSGYVFIQTNKPIYTPNQPVRIRVLSLDQNMLPSNRRLHVEVINPRGISVERLPATTAVHGLLSGEYLFHDYPPFGNWSVTAFYGHEFLVKSSVSFELKEYVLQTFSVIIKTPQYILERADSVVTRIYARYVFGKPVIGHYVFKYGVMMHDGTIEELGEKRGELLEDGSADVILDDLDADFGQGWFGRFRDSHFHTEVIVYERETLINETSINTKSVFVQSPYRFSARRTLKYFKPGLSLRMKLDLMYANGDVASGIPVRINTTAILSDGRLEPLRGPIIDGNHIDTVSYTDDEGRIGKQIFNLHSSVQRVRIEARSVDPQYPDANQAITVFEVSSEASANGNEFLLISPVKEDYLNSVVDMTENFFIQRVGPAGISSTDLYFLGITGGQIVLKGIKRNLVAGGAFLPIRIKSYMAPEMRLIAYYVNADGSVIADSLLIGIKEKCQQDPPLSLRILPELDVHQPDDEIEVEVTAPSNSTVGLIAVDGSVYLHRNKDRLTKQTMYDRIKKYDTGCGHGGGRDTAHIFKNSGLTVLTNAQLDVPSREEIGCPHEVWRKKRSTDDLRTQNEALMAREDFRETWFFDIVRMPEDGSPYLYEVSTPSRITEWHLTAFSLSPTQGMCIADDLTINVFQDFFVQLHLPYSIDRLEQTEAVATIFNYDINDLEVSINFIVEDGLCIAESSASRTVFVEARRSASVSIIIRPVETGEFKVTVYAERARKQDIVKKSLLVVPHGVLVREGLSVTLNPGRVQFNDEDVNLSPNSGLQVRTLLSDNLQLDEIRITLPDDVIPNSESCSVTLIGNLLETVAIDPIDGLDHLIRQPSGNGENIMMRLAVTLFTFQYMQAVGSDTAHVENRAYDYILHGVARQLIYKKPNGAYSAWTSRPGSTWLTAFVVKVFSHASVFTRIEPDHVEQSINWLIDNNQLASGAFAENLPVIHHVMIGGVEGETAMTAFVLISLLESRSLLVPANQKIDNAIRRATDFLENRVGQIVKVYEKAIVAYALAFAESAMATEANFNLWGERDEDGLGAVSFSPDVNNYRDGNTKPYWLTRRPAAITVEISAYALLAEIALHDYQKAGKIANWLSKQQNYDGGFVSTQDSSVALQALTEYISKRSDVQDLSMDIELTATQYVHSPGISERIGTLPFVIHRHHFMNDNAKLQKEVDASSSIGGILTMETRGVGIAKAYVELRYHTEKSNIDACPFHLNISAEEVSSVELSQNVRGLRITVCTRYLNHTGSPPMSIIDVGLYSGFRAVESRLREIVNANHFISSYEVTSSSVIFYFDQIPSDQDVCFTFSAESDVVVGNVQAASVQIYDYYNPDGSCRIFYKPGSGSALLSTLCSDDECICLDDSLGNSFSELDIPNDCNPDLRFVEEPQNSQHAEGDFVEPSCRVSDENTIITWFKDGQRLNSGCENGIFVDQYSELFIPSFDSRHEGHYACVVFAGDTECLRTESNITLDPLAFFTDVPQDAYIDLDVDDSHVFICTPKHETWSISWEKDGEVLENPYTRNGNLLLLGITEEDEGKYTCVVSDPWSRSTGRADAWLFLSDPPQIDISEVCGTVRYSQDNLEPTPSAELHVHTTTDADGAVPGVDSWSSIDSIGQSSDGDGNKAEARRGRIVGGTDAGSGSAPYMVRILEYSDQVWTAICGGTLLDQRWVMTAAHCMFKEATQLRKENINLVFGDYDTLTQEDSELARRPAEIIVHDEYDRTTYDNDIALIRIEPPLRKFTPYIRPICLAPYSISSRLMKTNILARVTGWGQQVYRGPFSRFLKEVAVPFVDRQTCQESVDDEHEFTNNMFCAGYHSAQRDACSGDSGGPLAVRYDDGRWYQLGIVSWGIGCAEEGEYGFYTHVSRFLHWLRSKNVTVAYSSEVGVRFSNSNGSGVLAFAVRAPSNLTVTAGSTVDLECVPNRDDASVEWFIGNSPSPVLMLVDGVRILPSGLVFHFDAIPEEFAGVYSCEARVEDEEGEQVIRADFHIRVTPP